MQQSTRTQVALVLGVLSASCTHDSVPHNGIATPDSAAGSAAPGSDGGATSASVSGDLPCEVQSFLTSQCTSCHDGTAEKAPISLLTRLDLLSLLPDHAGVRAGDEAARRVHTADAPMPPGNMLPDEVLAPFVAWVQAGMPAGSCAEQEPQAMPFEAVSPASALAKVKLLLTGLPPSADELKQVAADPGALSGMVDTWTTGPRFESLFLHFFKTAFQQTELIPFSLTDQLNVKKLFGNADALARLVDNIEESFARTALDIVREGRPFSDVLTTQRFELTTALTSFLLLLDSHHLDDALKLVQAGPAFDVRTEGDPITYADSIDPTSANYLHFTAIGSTNGCALTTRKSKLDVELFSLLLGYTPRAVGCLPAPSTVLFADTDFTDFHPVDVSTVPAAAEKPRFFALPDLRGVSTLPLTIPRMGFFTTPAFFANWASNDANQLRVTTNQTLIVALGSSFDGTDTTLPIREDGLSADHAGPGTACYACHKTLDPMRMFLRQSLTFSYHDQRDGNVTSQKANFAFQGVTMEGEGVPGLAHALAQHPKFASAWTQRLCFYANSSACAEDDPEFMRVAKAFADSGFDFRTLVRELFSSPLVTTLKSTHTFELHDPVVSISRRDHFCDALSTRLGLDDACGLGVAAQSKMQKVAEIVATSLPYDAYSRGSEVPVTLSDTNLFFRGATENLCATMAAQVVDVDATSAFRNSALEDSLTALVQVVMALPDGDERASDARDILRGHFQDAVAAGSSRVVAMRSTFVLACTAPSSVAVGL